ncbi:hypothetical protein [Occultella kanbiaonis]|uniref:hypothetical protein n=1 Tax=Occultella kanbiaonis TaxID=2675754 RepID=UPI0012B7EE72|nr:hypothetical protein [Occultella kanbiaonis]
MEVTNRIESRSEYLSFEAMVGARKLIEEIMCVKPGENVLITTDTSSDMRVADLLGGAAMAAGAHPVIVRYETRWASAIEPPAPVAGAALGADVWIELQLGYLMHSDAFRAAMARGTRYTCLTGLDVQMLVDTVAKVDYAGVRELGDKLVELLSAGEEIRITSANGMDITGRTGDRPIHVRGIPADKPGMSVMLAGQISWNPIEESQNGTIVFDGAAWPPDDNGLIANPITLTVADGVVTDVAGEGRDAQIYRNWLAAQNDPNMYRVAHWSLGYNPGVTRSTGRIVEDERVFGCVEFGIGTKGAWIGGEPWVAPAHSDGSAVSPSIFVDGTPIEEDGRYVHPELVEICRRLGVEGY